MQQKTVKLPTRRMLLRSAIAMGIACASPELSLGADSAAAGRRIPKTMRAAAFDRYGGPEVITLHTLPVPTLGPGEVLIAVHDAAVGSWDGDLRAHAVKYFSGKFPVVLGVDGAGTIAAVAPDVHGFKVGDRVYAYQWNVPKGGFYAQFVAINTKAVGHVPSGVSLRDAAAIGVEGLTALQGIDDALHIGRGQTILIHGASGGVGLPAVQFAKLRGARVLATASGEDGMALVKRLGADAAVDGRHGDIPAAARAFAPGGVDAVLGLAGGEPLEQCAATLHKGGQLAFPHGIEKEPHPREGVKIIAYDAVTGPAEFDRLNEAIIASKLTMPIVAEFPLAEAAKAHERLAAGHVLGRIVLKVR